MTRAELISKISSLELSEWMAFYKVEPFGEEAPYIGDAIVASTVANVHRSKNKKAFKISDFMPNPEPEKEQTVDNMIGFAEMLTKALGGKDERE